MALAFGGGVRPELGRTDYTPFLQGSVAGAQMQARGGESIGAALANLGQIAGKAIGEYQEKKQINQFVKQTSEDLFERVKNSPELFRLLGRPEDAKAVKVGLTAVGGGDVLEGIKAVKQAEMQQEREAMQRERLGASLAALGVDLNAVEAARIGLNVNEIATAQATQRQTTQAQQEQDKFAAANLASEIALKSLSEGKSIDEALDASREFANVDPRVVLDLYREYNALKPKDAANLQIEPREVVLDDGSKINFAAVWTGSQWQIIRPPEAAGDTAEIRNIRTRIDNFEKAQRLYRDGDRSGALNILRAMGEVLFRGSTITQRDLDEYFGPPDDEQDKPAPVTRNLFDEADRIIGGR
jgi:hypothetical protein